MELIKALLLGIVQGLTEFLPVSSSGHIELGKALLHFQFDEDENLLFTVVVHLATVCSTIVVFRKDIAALFAALFRFRWDDDTQFIAKIAVSMLPVGLVGLFFKEEVESLFNGDIGFVGAMLLITASLLALTHWAQQRRPTGRPVNFTDAFIIGIAQAIAVLPGISRSGSTIATGLLLGVDKSRVARFSFLMVIIPIIGIALLDLKDFFDTHQATTTHIAPLVAGFIGAFVAGWLACSWMIDIVKKGKLIYFAIYCAIVGLVAIAVSAM